MQITQEFRWVTKEDTEKSLTITGYNHKEKLLYLLNGIDSLQMSLYGRNFNFLYNTLGNETDNWIGKTIKVKQEVVNNKNIRTIY